MLLLRISNGPHRVALSMSSLSRYGRLGGQPLDPLHGLHVVRGCAVLAVDTIKWQLSETDLSVDCISGQYSGT